MVHDSGIPIAMYAIGLMTDTYKLVTFHVVYYFDVSDAALNEYVRHYEPVLVAHHDTHQRGHKLISKAHFSAHGRYT